MEVSAAGRVFSIAELLQTIIDYIPDESTLISLGMVSSTFSDASLSVIWRSLDSFYPLVRTLPNYLIRAALTPRYLTFVSSNLSHPFTVSF